MAYKKTGNEAKKPEILPHIWKLTMLKAALQFTELKMDFLINDVGSYRYSSFKKENSKKKKKKKIQVKLSVSHHTPV